MARRHRRKREERRQNSKADDGGLGFLKDNATDFYPDGVEDPKIIEAKYIDQATKHAKHLENRLLKALLL